MMLHRQIFAAMLIGLSAAATTIPGVSFADTNSSDKSSPSMLEKAGTYADETAITLHIKKVVNVHKGLGNVSVTTEKGIITLAGTVYTQAKKDEALKRATFAAKKYKKSGTVKQIINNITVESLKSHPYPKP